MTDSSLDILLEKKTSRTPQPLVVIGGIGVVCVVIVILGVVIGLNRRAKLASQPKGTTLGSTIQHPEITDDAALVQAVSKHMILPSEEPKIVTVTDVELLKAQQTFFVTAENGDKLLVYAQKVILYRPSQDKIVDIAQVKLPDTVAPSGQTAVPTTAPTPTQANTKNYTVTILNGAGITGLTKKVEPKVTAFKELIVSSRGNAEKTDYTKTTIVGVKIVDSAVLQAIATSLGGQVSKAVPPGELTPSSDILIILGADQE